MQHLRYWCQKVLPLVYDDSLSYYELLCKVVAKINEIIDMIDPTEINVYEAVKQIMDEWKEDGTLDEIINQELLGDLTDQIEKVNVLKDVRCLLIGNSFARGTGGTIGHGWPYYFQQLTGCNSKVIQQAGGDFVKVGNANADYPGMTYREALTSYTGTITEDQRNEFKHIVVGGGFNDANDSDISGTDLANEITAFCAYCRTNYPNAKISIIPLWSNANFSLASKLAKLDIWAIYGGYGGAATLTDSIYWFIGDTNNTYGDSIHLNDSGYAIAGRLIASFVVGGHAVRVPYVGEGCTLESGVTPVGTGWRITRDTQGQVSGTLNVVLPSEGTIDNTTKIAQLGGKFIPREALYFVGYDFTPNFDDRKVCCVCITSSGAVYFRAVEGEYPAAGHELYLHFQYRIGID